MVRGLAKATICGNVTRDPEVRTTAGGTSVTSFGIAVNRSFKTASGENQDETSFFDITAWGRTGETIAQYVKKGTPLLVSGRLRQHSWEDKNGGGKRSSVELVLEDFCFIGSGNDNGYSAGGSGAGSKKTKASEDAEVIPDDIPVEDGNINVDDLPF